MTSVVVQPTRDWGIKKGQKKKREVGGFLPEPVGVGQTCQSHWGRSPIQSWKYISCLMFQISQTNIVIGSVSNTYPGAPLSVILSDFHSVSVSETSQSVEMTLRWPTWRWTWWPTWRFNIVHREKLRSYVYDMAISFENITMQCTYTAHILQVLLTACGIIIMDYIGLPSWFHSHASLYRSCYIIQYWLHTLPIGGMYCS